jgi:hypothetical protein
MYILTHILKYIYSIAFTELHSVFHHFIIEGRAEDWTRGLLSAARGATAYRLSYAAPYPEPSHMSELRRNATPSP